MTDETKQTPETLQKGPLHILAVDDEQVNLDVITEHLERVGYRVTPAMNGREALDKLMAPDSKVDIVLLDRMMPEMDGMKVLHAMKRNSEYRFVPVIMQTAAAATNEIIEGIEAGAYYYLTKPYDKQTLLSIVGSAAQSIQDFYSFAAGAYSDFPLMECTISSHFRVQNLNQTQQLAVYLAKMCPRSSKPGHSFVELSYSFSELLTNAVEHGNLGIGYDKKTELLEQGINCWKKEIFLRQQLPENARKFVNVYYMHKDKEVLIRIIDEGKGFNWEQHMDFNPLRSMDSHGRGIAMANVILDKLEYAGKGNEVICHVYTGD